MIPHLIKYVQDTDLDIHGVNKFKKLKLSNYPLTIQILFINLLISFFGFLFFIIFNIYLIQNDKSILVDYEEASQNLLNIKNFLEKNSIVRVPLFDDRCKGLDPKNCSTINKIENNIELSEPVLEPKITQEYVLQNYFNKSFDVRIYNDDWIRLVDTQDSYDVSIVEESDLLEENYSKFNLYERYISFYINIFGKYYEKFIINKLINNLENKKSDIIYVAETIKKKDFVNKKILDIENNILQLFTSPIVLNDRVYGVVILFYSITKNNSTLSIISFNLFNFYILFVFIMIILSFIFSRELVSPIKKLSNLTILERDKVKNIIIEYPKRRDEIGALSNEIQNMSKDLKLQISQLEKFAADVSHELKNPLTSLQSGSDLLLNEKLTGENKKILINNINKDARRMNQLITDISNFTRLKAEVELEKNEYIDLNNFIREIPNLFVNNNKNINILIEEVDKNITIICNKNKLLQVFLNLIENSLSLSKDNTSVLIQIKLYDKNNINIKLYDQGRGISLEDSERIFNRFYTDREQNNDNHSGLGLSIAREIITSFQGTINLTKSDKYNYSGACFIINLPIKV